MIKEKYAICTYLGVNDTFMCEMYVTKKEYTAQLEKLLSQVKRAELNGDDYGYRTYNNDYETYTREKHFFNTAGSSIVLTKFTCKDGFAFGKRGL